MSLFHKLVIFIAPLIAAACVAPQQPPMLEPQARQLPPAQVRAEAQPFVIAANPLAARAGLDVLKRGGTAVDATIAVEAMLTLVEPQSSGFGGGAFLTYFDGATGGVTVYDGRETAPAGATPDMFLDDNGNPLPFATAVLSGRSTGVPGVVRMLELAHEEHGRLPWSSLFADAERTAREGFVVSRRMARFVHGDFPQTRVADVRAYFTRADGKLVDAGDRLRNPAYANFLRRLAAEGPDALYRGPTAGRIVERTRSGPLGSSMTLGDLAGYRPVKREPVCEPYRVYLVCVPPPPSSGVALLQLLEILERTDIASRGPGDPQAWFLFAEASRIMYADRDRYFGDPAFVEVPVAGLLDPHYVDQRTRLIGTRAGPPPEAGVPPGAPVRALGTALEPVGTTHFIVGDRYGNVVSMTATVESIYGSGRMVDGFFLNNELTDFDFRPRNAQGLPAANAVAPGKRPRSSMTPLIMLDTQGGFAGALGSAGGTAILAYVGKSLVGAIDWELPMQQSIALPNLVARGNAFRGEVTEFQPQVLQGLRERGIDLQPGQGEDSGLQGVIVRQGRVDGGADPRREGIVLVEPAG